ncbi:MAG: CoA transferase subunit A [Candidatus Bipolaricaulota bacterium]
MEVLKEGQGELIGWHDPDRNRQWVREHKTSELVDKRITADEAIERFLEDGDILASGGFGHVRISTNLIYEIIRQNLQNLTMLGKTAVHDMDLLIAAGCVDKVEVAYSFGHEIRGLSPASRRKVENGECKVAAEISNAGFQWRFLAAMMGIPFIPARVMGGTDTFDRSSAKMVEDPWSGKKIALLPACYPDVSFIHVHSADKYGNSRIEGTTVEDIQLSAASRRLIITTEKLIDTGEIRKNPEQTVIPHYLVDAVVVQKYASHPGEMPGRYYYDEEHISEWLKLSKEPDGIEKYLNKYVFGVENFEDYLEIVGGEDKIEQLRDIENGERPPEYPWAG